MSIHLSSDRLQDVYYKFTFEQELFFVVLQWNDKLKRLFTVMFFDPISLVFLICLFHRAIPMNDIFSTRELHSSKNWSPLINGIRLPF